MVYHYSDGVLEYEEHFNSAGTLQELLKYSYDADGNVEYLLYKDNNFSSANAFDLYYYVRDAVGNITDLFQIREQSGSSTTVVNRIAAHYEYDPYGNILSIDKYNNDPIGDINPIRYKDYYYDLQTGWYQLSSRFYDPEVGRFLNADDLGLLTETNSSVVDKNLYAYCDGNPVMRKDEGGQIWNFVIGAVAGAAIGVAVEIAYDLMAGQKITWQGVMVAAATGAASGVVAASGAGLAAVIGINAGLSATQNVVNQVASGKTFNTGSLLMDTAGGAISGALGGRGMLKSANIKTLNNRLMKKVTSGSLTKIKKGVKYYYKMTRKAYKKWLFKPFRNSGLFSLSYGSSKGLYNRGH